MKLPWLSVLNGKLCGILLLSAFLFSCEKEPDSVGLEITPPQDQLYAKTVENITIWAHTLKEDTMRTQFTSVNLLGAVFDPVFGKMTASLYTQLVLQNSNVSFGTNPQLDSLVLTMAYNGYYGDTTFPMTVRVYELGESLSNDSTYFQFSTLKNKGVELARKTFYPHPTRQMKLNPYDSGAFFRMNMSQVSKELGNRLLNAGPANLSDDAHFTSFFKGLYIAADPVTYGGSVLYFTPDHALTNLIVYYHNSSDDSLSYSFKINTYAASFGHFDSDNYRFADQMLRRQVIYKDTALGDNLLYVQGMAGLKVKLEFPFLKNWGKTAKIAVNQAILIIPAVENSSEWAPPVKLLLKRIDADGLLYTLADENDGASYFGGDYNASTNDYRFRLNYYVQELINGKTNEYGLSLFATGSAVRANRVILGGPKNANRPMKLQIIYSVTR